MQIVRPCRISTPVKRAATAELRRLLSGGDRRSIAKSKLARVRLVESPDAIGNLVKLTKDADWLVRMRALDLLEKLTHDRPDWIQPFRRVFIGPLADSEQWEIQLQIVRALPQLRWTARERDRAIAILRRDVKHPQKFVSAWALDSLAKFAKDRPSLWRIVRRELARFESSGSKALATRARQIRKSLAVDSRP